MQAQGYKMGRVTMGLTAHDRHLWMKMNTKDSFYIARRYILNISDKIMKENQKWFKFTLILMFCFINMLQLV